MKWRDSRWALVVPILWRLSTIQGARHAVGAYWDVHWQGEAEFLVQIMNAARILRTEIDRHRSQRLMRGRHSDHEG